MLAVQVCEYHQPTSPFVATTERAIKDIYFLAFPSDRTISRWLVGIVFLLETAQVIVIANDMFQSFAIGFGNPGAITGTHATGFSGPILAGTGASGV